MSPQKYQAFTWLIYNDYPLVGWLLRWWAVWYLAKDRSGDAITILAELITLSRERNVKRIALKALSKLRSQESVDAFCRVWAQTRHKDLTTVLKSRVYLSSEPKLRVLTALKNESFDTLKKEEKELGNSLLLILDDLDRDITRKAKYFIAVLKDLKIKATAYFLLGSLEEYDKLDFDYSLLIETYQQSSNEIKNKIEAKVKSIGTIEALKAISRVNHDFISEYIEDMDWINLADIILKEPKLKDFYWFINNAPPKNSKELLDKVESNSLKNCNEHKWKELKELIHLAKNVVNSDLKVWTIIPFLFNDFSTVRLLQGHSEMIDSIEIIPPRFKIIRSGKEENFEIDKYKGVVEAISKKTYTLWELSKGEHLYTSTQDQINSEQDRIITISLDGNVVACAEKNGSLNLWILPHIDSLNPNENLLTNANITDNYVLYRAIWHTYQARISSSYSCASSYKLTIELDNIERELDKELINRFDKLDLGKELISKLSLDRELIDKLDIEEEKNIVDWRDIKCLKGYSSKITSLEITQDKSLLVSGSEDGSINLWQIRHANHLKTIKSQDYKISCLATTPDGHILFAAHTNKTISLWQLPQGIHLRTLTIKNGSPLKCIKISLDGKVLISLDQNNKVNLWDLPSFNVPINKYSIQHYEKEIDKSNLKQNIIDALKFTLALVRLRQQFDIDIEEVKPDIQAKQFDIEIEG
jgi:WD40 repeat protein